MMRQYQQSDISKFRVTVDRILLLHLIILLDCVIWPAYEALGSAGAQKVTNSIRQRPL